jgi:hypothetical protein
MKSSALLSHDSSVLYLARKILDMSQNANIQIPKPFLPSQPARQEMNLPQYKNLSPKRTSGRGRRVKISRRRGTSTCIRKKSGIAIQPLSLGSSDQALDNSLSEDPKTARIMRMPCSARPPRILASL